MGLKIVGIFILFAAAAIAFLTLNPEQLSKLSNSKQACHQLTPAEQLLKLVNDDFRNLEESKQLPAEWAHIGTVEYKIGSSLARALLGQSRPGIQRVKEGTAYLEMEVLDLPDEENPGIIIQASLFDIKSKNKIFEIGRTYSMNTLNKIQTQEPQAPPRDSKNRKTKKIETH